MANYFKNVYLSTDSFYVIHVGYLGFVEDLDGDFLISQNMHTFLHFSKCSLSKRFSDSVGSDSEALLLLL